MKIEILKQPSQPPRLDYPLEEVGQAGKPGHLDTILEVLKLQPDQLYLCCGQDLDGLEIFAGQSKRRRLHWARIREQFNRQAVEADAVILRPRTAHPRLLAWYGATFQNALSPLSILRGVKALQVLNLFERIDDPNRFKAILDRERLTANLDAFKRIGWSPPIGRASFHGKNDKTISLKIKLRPLDRATS